MKRQRSLALSEQYPKVSQFLDSIARSSISTKNSYSFALNHMETFLGNEGYNLETVIPALKDNKINVYDLIDRLVGYLVKRQDPNNANTKLQNSSIHNYIAGVRSYLEYYDIDVLPRKFKRKVRIPKQHRRIKEPIDSKDIRTILQACTNARLRVFLLVLGSSGMRATEALTLRLKDIDFNVSPTVVRIRAEYSKTRREHKIYISDEASTELKGFIKSQDPNHLIFSLDDKEKLGSHGMYGTLNCQLTRVLKKVEMDKRKDGQGIQRREISFHSLRAYVFSTVTDNTSTEFAKWVLNHKGSTYYGKKPEIRRELYLKCEPFLTFLSYDTVESVGKDYLSKLQEMRREKDQQIEHQDKEIEELKMMYANLADTINSEFPPEVTERIGRKMEEAVRKGRFKNMK